MLMTEERDGIAAEVPAEASDAVPEAVTTGVAARILRPAANRLGKSMTGQQVRGLANSGDLTSVRFTETGWRYVSLASVHAYREKLERQFTELEGQSNSDAE